MKHVVDMSWTDNLAFETNLDGHNVIINASEEAGGSNFEPTEKVNVDFSGRLYRD